jgi:hypothetical protein
MATQALNLCSAVYYQGQGKRTETKMTLFFVCCQCAPPGPARFGTTQRQTQLRVCLSRPTVDGEARPGRKPGRAGAADGGAVRTLYNMGIRGYGYNNRGYEHHRGRSAPTGSPN